MKRIISVILMLVMVFSLCSVPANADITSIETAEQYELWTQSPYRTCGMTVDDVRLEKALEMNALKMYDLPKLGERYYFAVAEGLLRNSGRNGKTNLNLFYYYLLLETDDGYIIIDCCEPFSSYMAGYGHLISDVSEKTVEPTSGARVLYVITPENKYTALDWDDYNDYAFITDDKRMSFETRDNYRSEGGFPIMYEGKFYWGNDSYFNGSSSGVYYTSDGSQAMRMTAMSFQNGSISFGSITSHKLSDVTSANGYTLFESYNTNLHEKKLYKIPYSDDLYFSISYPYTYSEIYGRSYYFDEIKIYRRENGYMNLIKTELIETKKGSPSNHVITELGGIDTSYYESEGQCIPAANIGNTYILTNTGKISVISLNSSIYTSSYYNYALYNGKLVIIRYRNPKSYINITENGTTVSKQALNYVNIDRNGKFSLGEDIYLDSVKGGNPGQNGYYYPISTYVACSAFKTMTTLSTKQWWMRGKGSTFDDGRTVEGEWYYVGNYYELWYVVRKADGTVCALGPTGYTVSSTNAEKELFCIAIGDSKFIVSIKDINSDFAREYYRVAIVNETADGNVMPSVSIGNKTLTPPEDTDTVPVQNVIDFGEDNLPIGYNLRNNVVSSDKLDSEVREQINAIRLNDIVIVKNTETASGVQNTGTTLDYFEEYDASMGVVPIVVHSNGQNFCWYSPEVDALTPGVYNKNYTVGDKVIYVTFKIVEAPDNKGTTTVVF